MDSQLNAESDLCDQCCNDATSLGTTTFTTEWDSVTEGSLPPPKAALQRDLARVKYYRDLIQQQIMDYQRVRLEEEHFEQELKLDKMLEQVWQDAQEAIEKDAMFRDTYNTLMDQEESQIKRTAQYLHDTVPIRDELFGTLCVTNRTERNAVENVDDMELNYRRRITDLVATRNRLQQKLRTFRNQYEQTQKQKRDAYDEILDLMDEIDHLESEQQLQQMANLAID